ncbi:integrase core domain-containing protein [Paraburkholderia silvatlantica]|uniref:Integrase catalytic domain-containing protein n=1 Tax=Paraburkholderia silvatlantica TaxID=321895 RepID=A0ABR6FUW5_9BURK|nr:hypothetical protein [Paraburkholderia silvatlantica]
MGTAGDAYDNAMSESFFGTLEAELLSREHFATREQARQRIFWFLEGWYNVRRLHSSIGYRSALEFENLNVKMQTVSPCGLPTGVQRHGRDRRPAPRPWTTPRLNIQRRLDRIKSLTANPSVEPGQLQPASTIPGAIHLPTRRFIRRSANRAGSLWRCHET